MELKAKNNVEVQEPVVSVLQGDGVSISRILTRESSVGKSSRMSYHSARGVPFKWEMQPGIPKNRHEDEDFIPPVCPSPLMQSLGLPLPVLHYNNNDETALKTLKIRRLRKTVKKRINIHYMLGRRSKQHEISSTFSSPFSTSNRVADVSSAHAPFCSPPAILGEGNTKIYYCRQHKDTFSVEEDELVKSLSKKWTLKKVWCWIRRSGRKKKIVLHHEISLGCEGKMDEEFDASCLRKSVSDVVRSRVESFQDLEGF